VKLLIVDDSSAVYGRLLAMLGGIERLTALAIARSLQEAIEKSKDFCPDAVVMDVHLPDGSALDTIAVLKRQCGAARVYIFSNRIECRAKAMASGADGFYDKSLEFEALVDRLTEEPAEESAQCNGNKEINK
jgi:DNA-binding NarL/FixJ family response regulator